MEETTPIPLRGLQALFARIMAEGRVGGWGASENKGLGEERT